MENRLAAPAREAPEADAGGLQPFLDLDDFRLPRHNTIHALATDPACLEQTLGGVPYPDHVVFLAPAPLVSNAVADFLTANNTYRERMGRDAEAVLVKNSGVIVPRDIGFSAEEMLLCQANTFLRVPPGRPLHYLSPDDVAALLDWDAEKFRRGMSA